MNRAQYFSRSLLCLAAAGCSPDLGDVWSMVLIEEGGEVSEWPFSEYVTADVVRQRGGIVEFGSDKYLQKMVRLYNEAEPMLTQRDLTYYDISTGGSSDNPVIRYTLRDDDDGETFTATCESSVFAGNVLAYDCEGLLYERSTWTVGNYQ